MLLFVQTNATLHFIATARMGFVFNAQQFSLISEDLGTPELSSASNDITSYVKL